MTKFKEPVDCPCCGYPFGTVAPDECPGCNAEIVGVTRVSDTRFEYDRPVHKRAGELLRLAMKLGAEVGSRGVAAARREPIPPTMCEPVNKVAREVAGYAESLFDYRHVCESIGVKPLPLEELKRRAAAATRSIVQVVDDAKREAIERYQREQDRKIDKPVCVKCGRAVEPWAFDYPTATCSTCIEKAKR